MWLAWLACTRPDRDPPPAANPTAPPAATADTGAPAVDRPNVLLVLLDDVGTDLVAAYGRRGGQPRTPTLDQLAASGRRFRAAYASPECSPTRAAVLTGRYGRRTGIGVVVDPGDPAWLAEDEVGLPEVLAERGYTSALCGKWHLGAGPDLLMHPASAGFDRFAGSTGNLGDWYRWQKDVDGALVQVERYATEDTTDDALVAIDELPEPWLVWVGYNAAHGPYVAPPDRLLPEPLAADADVRATHRAMVEGLDAELGRLLAGLAPEVRARTTIVVMGDNGTPAGLGVADPERAKNTVYEGGIRVPLLVSGWGVAAPGAPTDSLVHAVDVFATLADLAGATPTATVDGQSFRAQLEDPEAEGRALVWSEKFEPNGPLEVHSARSIRDRDWKLVRTRHPWGERVELFRLDPDARDEGPDLVPAGLDADAAEARDRLLAALDAELAALAEPGPARGGRALPGAPLPGATLPGTSPRTP